MHYIALAFAEGVPLFYGPYTDRDYMDAEAVRLRGLFNPLTITEFVFDQGNMVEVQRWRDLRG